MQQFCLKVSLNKVQWSHNTNLGTGMQSAYDMIGEHDDTAFQSTKALIRLEEFPFVPCCHVTAFGAFSQHAQSKNLIIRWKTSEEDVVVPIKTFQSPCIYVYRLIHSILLWSENKSSKNCRVNIVTIEIDTPCPVMALLVYNSSNPWLCFLPFWYLQCQGCPPLERLGMKPRSAEVGWHTSLR